MVRSVAVIGAGVSGLGAVKSCLEEGLEPICFEKSDDIGGLWYYKEEVEEGKTSIYWSLYTNSSKEMMCYSDFPMPADFPNYLHNSKFLEYLKLYADHFNLMKHIKLKTNVCCVRKRPDFSTTGQWEVVTESDGKQESAIFDAIMLCTGRYVDPCYPLESSCGLEKFKGKYFHSREYKHPDGFQGKRVLVVGIGNSGVDIATEVSHFSKQDSQESSFSFLNSYPQVLSHCRFLEIPDIGVQEFSGFGGGSLSTRPGLKADTCAMELYKVFLSTKRGGWVLSRLSDRGYPWDTWFTTRFKTWIRQSLPATIVNRLIVMHLNQRFDQSNYGMQRESSIWKEPMVNDDLPVCIIRGSVVIKPGVREYNENSVTFDDGTVEDIDIVIFATGHHWIFPYLDDPDIKFSNKEVFLYKNVFPPDLQKSTLAFIGLIQPIASILVAVEMQARWASRVFKGLIKLPSCEKQKEDLLKNTELIKKRCGTINENVLAVEYIEYLDEIASEIGVKPSILHLLLTDPRLALDIFFGPCTSPQYRLTGPGKWDGARDAILTKWDRILKPMKTRVVKPEDNRTLLSTLLVLLCLFALFASVFMF